MSDTASPIQPVATGDHVTRDSELNHLSPEAIDRLLGDFRTWLGELAAPVTSGLPQASELPHIDLATLVGQFTALRHEVNLQTKSNRSIQELNSEALKKLGEALEMLRKAPGPSPEQVAKPILKAVTDLYDHLALARRQVDKQREALFLPLNDLLQATEIPELPELPEINASQLVATPGFWQRLLGGSPSIVPRETLTQITGQDRLLDWCDQMRTLAESRREQVASALLKFTSSFDGLLTGYDMSLARIDRVLQQFEVEAIPAEGERFDPDYMEVIEVVEDPEFEAGCVVEEVRRGYRWRGQIFRYAQVKVARQREGSG